MLLCRGRSRNFKKGPAEFFSKRGGGEGVQPLTREQFVLQINKIFSKKGGGGGPDPLDTPLDLPLLCAMKLRMHTCKFILPTPFGRYTKQELLLK